MPTVDPEVLRPGSYANVRPEKPQPIVPLTDEERDALAQMVLDEMPLTKMVEENLREWSDEEWQKVLKMSAFLQTYKKCLLSESDDELSSKARRWAGAHTVDEALGKNISPFGSIL